MKISNPNLSYINQAYSNPVSQEKNNEQPKTKETSNNSKQDTIELSEQTQYFQKISQAMDNNPAQRTKYVAKIKQQVENNQYNINTEAVAEKMIGSIMNEIS